MRCQAAAASAPFSEICEDERLHNTATSMGRGGGSEVGK